MSRVIVVVLAVAACFGCAGAPPPASQMAPAQAAKPDPADPRKPSPTATVEPAAPVSNDGIAARINNEIITWKDVQEVLKEIRPADVTLELKKSKLREMAEERMFLQAAAKNKLSVTDQELDETIRRDMKMASTEDEFEKVVRLKYGTKTNYREDKKKQLLILKLYRHLMQMSWSNPGVGTPGLMLDFVPPEVIRKYYLDHAEDFQAIEQVAFLRIALQFGTEQEEDKARARAESVLRKLDQGAEFAMLAFFYSDVRRARDFRDRGVGRKDLKDFYTPETIHYLFDVMKEGETSPIVKDGKTLNIFKMDRKVNESRQTFEEAQPKIRAMLENRAREENRRRLRDHLRKDAYLWPPDLFEFE